ncbi:MAG: hypothetical protein COA50_11380 [Flavobacteriaceae bacterium]|nr:MAG: hypothetical protein COA50_11380 [Flavobacteriaceae bacterium]
MKNISKNRRAFLYFFFTYENKEFLKPLNQLVINKIKKLAIQLLHKAIQYVGAYLRIFKILF